MFKYYLCVFCKHHKGRGNELDGNTPGEWSGSDTIFDNFICFVCGKSLCWMNFFLYHLYFNFKYIFFVDHLSNQIVWWNEVRNKTKSTTMLPWPEEKAKTSMIVKNENTVINSYSCHSKDLCSSSEHKLGYFLWNLRAFWPCVHRQQHNWPKAQKGSKDIVEIVHMISVVQPSFYETTRILFVYKKNLKITLFKDWHGREENIE